MWDIESVSWMFATDPKQAKKNEEDTQLLVECRDVFGARLPLMRALLASKGSMADLSTWGGEKLPEIMKSVEDRDFRATASLLLGTLVVADVIINPSSCPDRKAAQVKGIQYLANSLGLSKQDLPDKLRSKLDVGPEEVAAKQPNAKAGAKRKKAKEATAALADEESAEPTAKKGKAAAA
ncbi:unnamed protein product, partial [Effrenium voratum]